jgi:serine/threonine protein kinase
MYQKHCPGCFENKQGFALCPHCGYDESAERSPLFLPHGTLLADTYRIGRVLGRPGGFGVTYLAWDIHLQNKVAVKEYLPRDMAGRGSDSLNVFPHVPDQKATFEFGLEQFLTEARMIAKFDHPHIVRVRNFFRSYGTAYLVMDFYEGRSLGDYLSHVEQAVEPKAAARLLAHILEGLHYVHDHGVLHRDVKPHNIYLASNGRSILLDFGSARHAAGERVESMSVVLSEGYAPLEQYQKNSVQGPWTDIYGVAATLYRMLKGRSPPAALDRLGEDALQKDLDFSPELNKVMQKALAVHPEQRYASALEFKTELYRALDMTDTGSVETRRFMPIPDAKAAVWSSPSTTVTKRVDADAGAAGRMERRAVSPTTLRREARLIAAAILLGALIISLPLWLR